MTRPTVIVKLHDKPEAHQTMRILEDWGRQRKKSTRLIEAVRLYNALLAGDKTLLRQQFPFIDQGGGGYASAPPKPTSTPKIEVRGMSAEKKLENALDIFSGLEIDNDDDSDGE